MSATPELSPLQRKALKAQAHHLDPVVMIGDAGLTPSVMREINIALTSHGLIKVRVLGDDREARNAMFATVSSELGAAAVQSIGKLLVFYRPKPETPAAAKKVLKPRGPRKTKKQLAARVPKTSTKSRPPKR